MGTQRVHYLSECQSMTLSNWMGNGAIIQMEQNVAQVNKFENALMGLFH
jgi:hypothetical protein